MATEFVLVYSMGPSMLVKTYRSAYIYKRKLNEPDFDRSIQEINEIFLRHKFYELSYGHSYSYEYRPHRRWRRKVNIALKACDEEALDRLRKKVLL